MRRIEIDSAVRRVAHVNSDRVEVVYQRSDLFDRRWILMND